MAMAIRTRDEGLFVPVSGPSGTGKTTLADNLTYFLPNAFAPTLAHQGLVEFAALHQTATEHIQRRRASDDRVLPFNIDHREATPPTDAELAELKRFLRSPDLPVRPIVLWPDTSLDNCSAMAVRFERIAGPSPVPLPVQLEGPPRRAWTDIAINTLRLVNQVESLEDLGIDPRMYSPEDFNTIGDFLRRISTDFDDRIFQLQKDTQKPITIVFVFVSESQEPGVLSQLTSSSRYGLVDPHAMLGVTPESEFGRWWDLRRGLLTRAVIQLSAHALSLPPSASIGILRRYGDDAVRKLLAERGIKQPGVGRVNRDIERSDVGRFLANDAIRAYEARGTPAAQSVAAYAAVAMSGLVFGRDKELNGACAQAIEEYLRYRGIGFDRVTSEKVLDFCGLVPDNAIYTQDQVVCLEYAWRKGNNLASANRAATAQYILKKLRDYVRQLGWTTD
jgi:hypothetical protein